jgi:hypothetical protein
LKPLPRILASGEESFMYSNEHNEKPKDVHVPPSLSLSSNSETAWKLDFCFPPEAAMNHLFSDTYPAYFGVKHNRFYGGDDKNK